MIDFPYEIHEHKRGGYSLKSGLQFHYLTNKVGSTSNTLDKMCNHISFTLPTYTISLALSQLSVDEIFNDVNKWCDQSFGNDNYHEILLHDGDKRYRRYYFNNKEDMLLFRLTHCK
jgi:hypothetical protein